MTADVNSMLSRVKAGRQRRTRRWRGVMAALGLIMVTGIAVTLMLGQSFTPPQDVLRVLMGESVSGASFTVGHLRLPRAVLSVLVGMCFGLGGVAFQIMLRNPLASPDIIGISLGASAAAVFAIVILQLHGPAVSVFAVVAGLGVALVVYGLSFRNGVAGTRLILIGIGVAAMIESFIAYILSRAPAWDLQEAMRWLTGSVNAAQLSQALPVLVALVLFGGILLSRGRDLEALRMGDDTAAALGVRVGLTRVTVMVCAVGMIAVATAVTGPVAFVAFLSGPIAARIIGPNGSLLIPSALIGACLVLVGDYRAVPVTEPLSGWRSHRRAGRTLSYLPDHSHEPQRRLAVTAAHHLVVEDLSAGYGERTILEGLDLDIAPGCISSIVGANACGKSTLLRTISRLLAPSKGQVLLDGKSVHRSPTRELARTLGLLPQSPISPEGITVADLVSLGRHPHHGLMSRWNPHDDEAVANALEVTKTTELADREVDELSGGQRQRVWIAMALAQETDLLLLDEPTTFLDVSHQVEVLDLLTDLNHSRGITIVMVLHDLNLAARYSDRLVAMEGGRLYAHGKPEDVLNEEMILSVFGLRSQVIRDPISDKPMMLPIGRHRLAKEVASSHSVGLNV